MVWSAKTPPLPAATYYVRLPTTCYSLLPIYYLLPITTYYYLLPATNYYLPHPTPPHRGRGDWTMLLLLGYHDHGWGVGGGPRTWNIYIYIWAQVDMHVCVYIYIYTHCMFDIISDSLSDGSHSKTRPWRKPTFTRRKCFFIFPKWMPCKWLPVKKCNHTPVAFHGFRRSDQPLRSVFHWDPPRQAA